MDFYSYKYGDFSSNQIHETKQKMVKQMFFLLQITDPVTAEEYDVDVKAAYEGALSTFGGLNGLLDYPQELVEVMALVYAAYLEYQRPRLNWGHCRKLLLDAGNAVKKIKEVNDYAEP